MNNNVNGIGMTTQPNPVKFLGIFVTLIGVVLSKLADLYLIDTSWRYINLTGQ